MPAGVDHVLVARVLREADTGDDRCDGGRQDHQEDLHEAPFVVDYDNE
jgi:hypothetical protein